MRRGRLALHLHMAINQYCGIHGASGGAGNAINFKPEFFEKPIEHAPGKGAVSSSTLQRQVNENRFSAAKVFSVEWRPQWECL